MQGLIKKKSLNWSFKQNEAKYKWEKARTNSIKINLLKME